MRLSIRFTQIWRSTSPSFRGDHATTALLTLILCLSSAWAYTDAAELTQWEGVYSSAQAERGRKVYEEHCALCHTPLATGNSLGPPLVGFEFAAQWDGFTLGEMFERIQRTMPQNNPGGLGEQDYVDVLAYMLALNEYPAGEKELPAKMGALDEYTFVAEKP